MEKESQILQNAKWLMVARYPRFAQQIANANLQFCSNLPSHTAATDGKNVYFDPDFFEKLDDNGKLFVIAHELMHIKFEHMYRMTKNGEKRDQTIWNIATDAIINANLERDGFKIMDGLVNMPEALGYCAEELYVKLLEEKTKEKKQHGGGQNNNGEAGNGGQQNKIAQSDDGKQAVDSGQNAEQQNKSGQYPNGKIMDDHSFWEKAFEEREENQTEQRQLDEKLEFEENRIERRKIAKQKFSKLINREYKKCESEKIEFGEVGRAKPVVDWKLILRREFEKSEFTWSQRRSIAENNFAYRLDENDDEDEAETEVMLDVSGSIDDDFLKAFLRQLKPLLKESKMKVGFFADRATEEFQEIKSERDIDRLEIVTPGQGTNMDAAARAFSNSKLINKIVFTDGWAEKLPGSDLKDKNIIWLVYDCRDFKPCCGKVINVDPKAMLQLAKNHGDGKTR